MVASARVAHLVRRAADYGVECGPPRIDMARVRQRKRDIVRSFGGLPPDEVEPEPNLEHVYGEASFTGPRALEVRLARGGTRRLTADKIFVNIEKYGNTSAASIPIAFDELVRSGQLDSQKGKQIIFCAFGAGNEVCDYK